MPQVLLALFLAPLAAGLISRVKAVFAGRVGPPLLQPYHDLARLLRKGVVYSPTTTAVFRLAPPVVLACSVVALLLVPFVGQDAALAFPGDFLLLAGLFALARFAMALAALDTGSSFEGMGASREVWIGALAEGGLLLSLAAAARQGRNLSLSGLAAPPDLAAWEASLPVLALLTVALLILALAENSRLPVDDPATHLELTMVHEVMILDHSGPDLAALLYASQLKLWLFGTLVLALVVPVRGPLAWLAGLVGMTAFLVAVGVVESVTARLPLARVPQFLALAMGLAALALLLGG